MLQLPVERLAQSRLFVRANSLLWHRVPKFLHQAPPMRAWGGFVQQLVRTNSPREQNPRTYFLRNRPELEWIQRLATWAPSNEPFRVAIIACSMGAEAFSVLSAIHDVRPDLQVTMQGVDISAQALEIARGGIWSPDAFQLERLTAAERTQFFEPYRGRLRVREWLRDQVTWHLADARSPALVDLLGPQDLVIGNRFLCHMQPAEAEACLRNLARLVAPSGHLICSGVDVDVRTRVARELGWEPERTLLEEIHEGDYTLRDGWPWQYWGLEPLDKAQPDWVLRYASIFRLGRTITR